MCYALSMPSDTNPFNFHRLVAGNVKAMRTKAGWSQDELAKKMRDFGFTKWSRAIVAALEADGRQLTREEEIGLAIIFECALEDLYATKERVLPLNEETGIRSSALRRILRGEKPSDLESSNFPLTDSGKEALNRSLEIRSMRMGRLIPRGFTVGDLRKASNGELERGIAKTLGESSYNVAAVSLHLWGHSATEERERRVEQGQARQWASRDLREEIQDVFDKEGKRKRGGK